MNMMEILEALEGLKDMVNSSGKQSIDGIKAAIRHNLNDRLEFPKEAPAASPSLISEDPPEEEFTPKNKPEKPKVRKAVQTKKRK